MNKTWTGEVRDAYHRIFGVPDYETYLAHMQARHPGEPMLTRKEFANHWIDRRYGNMRSRCC